MSATSCISICPGALAFLCAAKVMAEPKLSPHSLLIIPIFPMDIVMTGVSGFSSLNSYVTDNSFKTSSIFCCLLYTSDAADE